jgi:diguanylate cyclase
MHTNDDERDRLAKLHSLNLLDTSTEPSFDRITQLTARVLRVPIALVTLIDAEQQWFKSCIGLDTAVTPRAFAFCAHTISQAEPMVVSDATVDKRFADNPLVVGHPNIRFYAGVPVCSIDGFALGTLCIIDVEPRKLKKDELDTLINLADLVSKEIQQRERLILSQHQLINTAAEMDARFQSMFERAAVGIALVAPDGGWLRVNATLCNIVGYSHEELSRLTFQDITHPDDLTKDLHYLQRLVAGEIDTYHMEKRYKHKDGSIIWVSLSVAKQKKLNGDLDYFVSIVENIQARKEAEASLAALRRDLEHKVEERTIELRKTNEMLSFSMKQQVLFEEKLLRRESELSAVLENANDAYVCIDQAGVVSAWNRCAQETFGWTSEEAIGQRIDELIIPPEMREAHRAGMKHYFKTGEAKVLNQRMELPAIRKDGSSLPVEIRIRAIEIDGQKIFSAFLHDITDRKRAEEIREREALHDPLTGLPNRRALFEYLPKAIARSNRHGKAMALLFLDLNDFKVVNDTLGHDAGDSLLKEISRRLCDCVRQTDTVARLSGDEFTVVIEDLAHSSDVDIVAKKLLSSIRSPIQIGTNVADVSVSIGIAIHTSGSNESAEELLKNADTAMYTVKRASKSNGALKRSSANDIQD